MSTTWNYAECGPDCPFCNLPVVDEEHSASCPRRYGFDGDCNEYCEAQAERGPADG